MLNILQTGNISELKKLNIKMDKEHMDDKQNSRNSIIKTLKEINKEEGEDWYPSDELIDIFYHESGMSYEDYNNPDPFVNELLNNNALQIACENEDINLLSYIFEVCDGYNIFYDNEWKLACEKGNIEIVSLLFNKKFYDLPKIKNSHKNVYEYLSERNMII